MDIMKCGRGRICQLKASRHCPPVPSPGSKWAIPDGGEAKNVTASVTQAPLHDKQRALPISYLLPQKKPKVSVAPASVPQAGKQILITWATEEETAGG